MDILITGGTGSIGRVLCWALLEKGHRLTVLSRKPERVKTICGESVTAIDSLEGLPSSAHFDAVVNLAGEPIIGSYWTEKRKKVLWASRVGLTEQLVGFIGRAETKPAVLISASAVGYYGDGGDSILDEDSLGTGGFAHALCDAWEKAALPAADLGVRVCVVRFGLVLMRHGGMLKSMLPSFRLGLGARIGDGSQWMPWIHCQDLVSMLQWLIARPTLVGVFNGVAPHPATNREFTASLAKHLKRPAFLVVPSALLKGLMGEMGSLLLEGQRVAPLRIQESGFQFQHETLDAALTEILG